MLVAFFLYICARNTKKTIIMQNLDALDEQILSMIADNARIPFLEVARVCHVSGAAIHQHIQKLTQMGVIKGSQLSVIIRREIMISSSRSMRITTTICSASFMTSCNLWAYSVARRLSRSTRHSIVNSLCLIRLKGCPKRMASLVRQKN